MKTCSKLLAHPMNIFNYEIQHTIIAVSAKYLVWGHFTGSSDSDMPSKIGLMWFPEFHNNYLENRCKCKMDGIRHSFRHQSPLHCPDR